MSRWQSHTVEPMPGGAYRERLLMNAFLSILEGLAALASIVAEEYEDGSIEREAMMRAAEELASIHARIKFVRLRD